MESQDPTPRKAKVVRLDDKGIPRDLSDPEFSDLRIRGPTRIEIAASGGRVLQIYRKRHGTQDGPDVKHWEQSQRDRR